MVAGQGHGSGGQGVKQLLNAVAKGSAERVAELLRQGTDPGTRDRRGRTPLHVAARRSRESGRVIRALAAAGLDPDATDRKGNSALHLAALRPNLIAYTALVEYGANPMLPNAKGLTPSAILERAVHPVTPSDAMYRFVFRHGPMARGLLGLVLPPGMVGEDAEVTAIDGDLVSHTLSHQLRSDLVLVLLREGARPVTVICEFQSGTDRDMAERMAAYRIETVRTVRRHHPELLGPDGRVPFTVGAVVHTGSGTWDVATDAAELMDPPDHPGLGIYRSPSAYSVLGVFGADFPDDPDNPAAAYFRLLRGDPEFVLPAARTLDRLLPLDKYRPLRHLLTAGVTLGVDAETYPEVRTILEGEPATTPFAVRQGGCRRRGSRGRNRTGKGREPAPWKGGSETWADGRAGPDAGTDTGAGTPAVCDGGQGRGRVRKVRRLPDAGDCGPVPPTGGCPRTAGSGCDRLMPGTGRTEYAIRRIFNANSLIWIRLFPHAGATEGVSGTFSVPARNRMRHGIDPAHRPPRPDHPSGSDAHRSPVNPI